MVIIARDEDGNDEHKEDGARMTTYGKLHNMCQNTLCRSCASYGRYKELHAVFNHIESISYKQLNFTIQT